MMIDIDRSVKPVITVRISKDIRSGFDASLIVYEADSGKQDSREISMNDAWAEMVQFSAGHPSLLYLRNNEVLAYYYAGTSPDTTDIAFVRISV